MERILVIGGARALGAAIARRAVKDGYEVVIGARDLAAAEAQAAEIGATTVRIDLQDEATIAAAAGRFAEGIDHIVSTGSAPHDVRAVELDHDKLVAAFTAKVIGPMLVAKHFAPVLRPSGSIVLFSGVVGWRPGWGSLVKGVTNGAVEYVARHLAADLAPVRVNAISPGVVDSGAWDRLGDSKVGLLSKSAAGTLVGRYGESDDVVDTVMWLLRAGFISGETIHLEGGARHKTS
ncbi:NAD(P)-dependent dehydrogenase (short-subunit alcohol dehydrogenase family) [Kribbella pratensis]|uniref:NAD(P)-dependent dehydrogenase (Short-subunit alcohol dehydrogenase family) n=1 Tax=Kribbella pratensis TaxID=2512112 RepID=A0ABY2F5K9_9ACTN|nr:SDR family oxidoreductase [Kribbella pratensis]TDW81842.1 NAD(P)-dependent dehydrogenase (short-subunit alcohol dehydrogenase family) [Kribbella pratensis]